MPMPNAALPDQRDHRLGGRLLRRLEGVEVVLADRLDALLTAGKMPDLEQLRSEFAPRQAQCPEVVIETPAASLYDALLDEEVTA
ncbi:hypothetical protein [Cupriavidus sp. 8B]|jgi:hypothetical protein